MQYGGGTFRVIYGRGEQASGGATRHAGGQPGPALASLLQRLLPNEQPAVEEDGPVAEKNRRVFGAWAERFPILLQEEFEVARLYEVTGTPAAYLLDQQATTVGPLALGAEAILALAFEAASGVTRWPLVARGASGGLDVGAPVPGFRALALDGGELALDDYRGRRVLLVAADPDCPPCDELAPELEHLHRHVPCHLRTLMISRNSLEANQAWARRRQLTFPIGLQRRWEITQRYGERAAPAGWLIDEQGALATEVAVGAAAVRALVQQAAAGATRASVSAAVEGCYTGGACSMRPRDSRPTPGHAEGRTHDQGVRRPCASDGYRDLPAPGPVALRRRDCERGCGRPSAGIGQRGR